MCEYQHVLLQELGNDIVAAANDIYDFGRDWRADMDKQPVWQFIYNNAPGMRLSTSIKAFFKK
jgi:hypothetical protein